MKFVDIKALVHECTTWWEALVAFDARTVDINVCNMTLPCFVSKRWSGYRTTSRHTRKVYSLRTWAIWLWISQSDFCYIPTRKGIFSHLCTGYPLVDACMRELSITGYASNHARLNAASFLAYTMSFDWRLAPAKRNDLLVCENARRYINVA